MKKLGEIKKELKAKKMEGNIMTTATLRKFNRLFEVGTKVKLFGRRGWLTVKSVHPTRQWVELEELIGSFQRGHIEKFTNKPAK